MAGLELECMKYEAISKAMELLGTSSAERVSFPERNIFKYEGQYGSDKIKVIYDELEQILIVSSSLDVEDRESIMMIANMEGEKPAIDFFREEDSSAWILGLEICLTRET